MSLARFLPLTLRRLLAEGRDLDAPLFLDGAALFADISGFTPLSEALGRMGREGAEFLTRTLNGYFGAVVGAIGDRGGDVMRFAGDAVTAFFPGPDGEARAVAAARAIQTHMAANSEASSPVGVFPIRIKVGIASGEHVLLCVGEGKARDYVFAGSPVDAAAEAEHHAGPGDIVLHPSCRGAGGDFLKVPPGIAPDSGPGGTGGPDPATEACSLFLHPLLVERLREGSEHLLNEHRRAAVLFVSFPGTGDYRDPGAVARLRVFYAQTRALVDRFEGHLNKVDMGDKGSKFLITFGAPLSHEDDADRAVHFALALKAAAEARGLALAVGLNRGTLFAGLIGDAHRCEYTVMGDEVNLAARLMQTAGPGRILAGPGAYEECRAFAFTALPPVTLKGKAQPVPVYEPQEKQREEKASSGAFIGRVRELREAGAFIRESGGEVRLLLVRGEAGIGKSAFLECLFREHIPNQCVISGWCREFTAQFPYHPWKFILRRLLEWETPQGAGPVEAWQGLLGRTVPELVPFAPLLLDLIEAPHGLASVTADEQTRKAVLHRQAGLLIREAARKRPLTLSLTDVQWMDPESRGLLLDLLRTLEPPGPVFVLSGRDLPGDLEGLVPTRSVALGPQPEAELRKMALAFLKVKRAPDKLLAAAAAASGGNPLLLRETLRAYLDSGYVARDEQNPELLFLDETRKPTLPTTLEEVVMARFDRLPAGQQALLKTLSVFGDSIPVEAAQRAARETGNDPALLEALAAQGEFLSRQGDGGPYYFPQSHVRSTIYDSLDFNSRRNIHLLAARIFRDFLPPETPETIQTLAFHYLQAGAVLEGKDFLLRAGRLAYDAYALPSALHYYQALMTHRDQLEKEDLSTIAFAQGSILLKMGKFQEIQTLLTASLLERIPQGDEKARLLLLLADSYRLTGVVNMADELLEKALAECQSPLQAFHVQISRGILLAQTGQLKKALDWFKMLLQEYRTRVAQIERVKISSIYGPLLFATGSREQAISVLNHAIKRLRKSNEPHSLIKVMHNLGSILGSVGDHRKALQTFIQSLQFQEQFGIYQYYSTTLEEVGYEQMLIGRWSDADYHYQLGLKTAQKMSDPIQVSILCNIAELEQYQGSYASASNQLIIAGDVSLQYSYRQLEVLFYWLEYWAHLPYPKIMKRTLHNLEKQMHESHSYYVQHLSQAYTALYFFLIGEKQKAAQSAQAVLEKVDPKKQSKEAYLAFKVLFLLSVKGYDQPEKLMEAAKTTNLVQYWLEAAILVSKAGYEPGLMNRADRILRKTPFANLAWRYYSVKAHYYEAHRSRAGARRYAVKAKSYFDQVIHGIPWKAVRRYIESMPEAQELHALLARLDPAGIRKH